MESNRKVAACHIISGDLWAGAEAQAFIMMSALAARPDVRISAIVLNHGKLATKLTEAGIAVSVIDESRHSFFQIVRRAQSILSERPADVLHSHRYKENLLAAMIKRRCRVQGLVQTVHGVQERLPGFKQAKVRLYGVLNEFVTRRHFERIIPVSHDICRQLAKVYGERRLEVVHNAIDINAVSVRRDAGAIRTEMSVAPETILVGTVGRLAPIKGFDVFLKVAAEVRRTNANIKFLIVGDGPERQHLERMAQDLNVGDAVIFTGFRDDVIDVVNALDIFMMTSWHEGVPVALLEAMVLGKAIISTGVGGVNEVIENGSSGELAAAGDHIALSESCRRLAGSSAERTTLGNRARTRVATEFSATVQSERLAKLYWSLVN